MCIHNHKTVRRVLYLSVLAIAFLTSCRDTTCRELARIEQLMETSPAEADSLLSVIPEPANARKRAWYAVLKTQLDYKLYREIESDSLILSATGYYGTPYKSISRHRKYRAAMAWYSQGCVYSELKSNLPAVNAYLKAIELFPDTLIRYYALSEQNLGKCYMDRSMYDMALSCFRASYNNGLRLNDLPMIAYSDYWISTIGLRNEQFNEVYGSFISLTANDNLSAHYHSESLLQLAKIHLFGFSDFDSTLYYLDRYLKETPGSRGAGYSLMGDAYYRMSLYDSAYSYLIKSSGFPCDVYTSCENSRRLYEMSSMRGDTVSAAVFASMYTALLDSIRIIRETNDIAKLEILHGEEISHLHEHVFKTRFAAVCMALFVFIILSFIIIFQHLKNSANRRYIHFSDESWSNVVPSLGPDASLVEMMEHGRKVWQNSPSYSFVSESTYTVNDEKKIKELYLHDLIVCFARVISYFKVNNTAINSDEMLQMFMCYLQIEKSTICKILNITDDTFRQNKRRLKDKLGELYKLFFNL